MTSNFHVVFFTSAELVEQPVDQLLTQLCRLKPGTGPSSSLSALKDAIDDVTSQCSSHNASQAQRMQMQQLLAIAGLHPAFTDIERAKFADAASGFPSLVITSRQDVPSSPTASTSPDGSASPLTPYSLSPQNSLHTDMADAHIGSAHLYAHHSPLHATFSAPSGARIAAPPASLGAKLRLAVTTHEKVQRSLSSSPSAGESENPSFCDSNGSLSNIPADETFVPYVHISPKPGMKGNVCFACAKNSIENIDFYGNCVDNDARNSICLCTGILERPLKASTLFILDSNLL
jgi:hypothetical protein